MTNRSGTTVLVVDDNPAHRYATVRTLSKAGFRVTEAWNAQQAMEEAPRAAAVVLDLFLPDMDGREVTRRLRANVATASLPIIHHSSVYVTDHDQRESQKSGANLFLRSPVAPGVLVDALDKLIQGGASGEQQGA